MFKFIKNIFSKDQFEDDQLLNESTSQSANITRSIEENMTPALPLPNEEDLIAKAKSGDSLAQFEIGKCYYNGTSGVEQNFKEAIKWFKIASQQNNPFANYYLGICFCYGRGTNKDKKKSDEYYTSAFSSFYELANNGNSEAAFYLAKCYNFGSGTERNNIEAIKWCENAAEKNNVQAMRELYLITSNTEDYIIKGVKWLHKGAELGDIDCISSLATVYEEMYGKTRNPEAIKWYQKAVSCGLDFMEEDLNVLLEGELNPFICITPKNIDIVYDYLEDSNDTYFILKLGDYYSYRIGYGDEEEAVKYYEEALIHGSPRARYELARLYQCGIGVPKDEKKSLKMYKQAFDEFSVLAQFGDSHAAYYLGCCYLAGNGTDNDYNESIKWFRIAAEMGNTEAMEALGIDYLHDKENVVSSIESEKWLIKGSEIGDTSCIYHLANCYKEGDFGEVNYDKALAWFETGAKSGDPECSRCLADMYFEGLGVEQSYIGAITWYEEGARMGDWECMYLLGEIYENGYGVQKSIPEAIKWWKESAQNGDENAIERLKEYGVTDWD